MIDDEPFYYNHVSFPTLCFYMVLRTCVSALAEEHWASRHG